MRSRTLHGQDDLAADFQYVQFAGTLQAMIVLFKEDWRVSINMLLALRL